MKVPTLRRQKSERLPGVTGTARVGRRTKDVTRRLRPGDIAVIDQVDIDRVSAEALIGSRAVAVVNASPSISGRYPNLGPRLIVEAGIPLLDGVGEDVLNRVDDGTRVRVHDDSLYVDSRLVATGAAQDEASVEAALVDARDGLSVQLEAFTANTMEYLKHERELLLDGAGIPTLRTRLRRRHCLVVVRGYHYREDLRVLRHYIREYRPVLIGVEGGADALLEQGYKPDIVVGGLDSVSDTALRGGAEIVQHTYRDGDAPGQERLAELGVEPVVFTADGTSEDIAMLLVDEAGASVIVAAGTQATLLEFLDKGRSGTASTFLTRLRVGGKLVDAKGASRLYRSRISGKALVALAVACVITMVVAGTIAPVGGVLGAWLSDLWNQVQYLVNGLFS